MYWCNCTEAWKTKAIKLPKNFYTAQIGIHKYQEVKTKDGECVHCGHIAFWSKVDPETVEIFNDQRRAEK